LRILGILINFLSFEENGSETKHREIQVEKMENENVENFLFKKCGFYFFSFLFNLCKL
jgi:hypothetical protein